MYYVHSTYHKIVLEIIDMADELDKILEEKYTNVLRPGYKWYGDIFMLTNFLDYAEPIKNFEVRDDDVWVSSFAKAG